LGFNGLFLLCNVLGVIVGMIVGCIIIFIDSVVFGIVIATTIDGNMETEETRLKMGFF